MHRRASEFAIVPAARGGVPTGQRRTVRKQGVCAVILSPHRLVVAIRRGAAILCAWLGIIAAAAAEPAVAIPVAPASAVTRIAIVDLPASVRLPLAGTVVVTAPLTGVVVDVRAGEGEMVRPGQVLALVQSRDAMNLDAELTAARGTQRVADAQAERDRQLFAEGIAAKARLEASIAARAAANARVSELEGVRRWAPSARGQAPGVYELRAPAAGRVLQRTLAPGDTYTALTRAFVIGRGDRVLLELRVPAGMAGSVRRGQEVRTREGSVATVTETGGMLDPASQTVLVRAEGAAGALVPGMQTTATLWVPAPRDAVSIPRAALQGEGAEQFVYARGGDGFRRIRVESVARDGAARRVVTGALKPGDEVAIGAFARLSGAVPEGR